MLFNSLHFAVFFPTVTLLYFAMPNRWRWALLLAASCYFYMAFIPVYVLILGFTIVVDYVAGLLIESAAGRRRRMYLALSVVANVGTLAVFKYFNFFIDNWNALSSALGFQASLPGLSLLLPIGLSFHTFQAMSYTIEVYRGHQPAERHFGIYALYVMFYPQLVAGPIERPQHLLHQFREIHEYERDRVARGLTLMAWGLVKKIVIADQLGALVAPAYARPENYAGVPLLLATVCFAFQIYCDFSGYSDVAIGSAEVMGFRLMRNFDNPYLATSIADFWKRWHISLSTWLRDYVFLPVSYALSRRLDRDTWLGVRHDVWVYGTASVFTMLLSGLWHGAAWTFVFWGALHGVYLAFGFATRRTRKRVAKAATRWVGPRVVTFIQTVTTFALVCVGWVFFRARSFGEASTILTSMTAGLNRGSLTAGGDGFVSLMLLNDPVTVFGVGVLLALVLRVEAYNQRRDVRAWLAGTKPFARWSIYYALVVLILVFAEVDRQQPFIYFQF